MLKINFTFLPVSRSRFFRNAIAVKKKIAATGNRLIDVLTFCRHTLFSNASAMLKASAGVALCVLLNNSASAQCNTFQNADAANPLRSVFPPGKKVAGFAFADIDGDGDQDVYVDFLGNRNADRDSLHLYRNIGTKTHPVYQEDKNTGFGNSLAGGQNGEMQFVDIDGDGDLDYFASDSTYYYYGSVAIFYYENVGTPQVPQFVPAIADFLPKNLNTRYIQPFTFADVDGDGDYDLYLASSGPYDLYTYNQRVYFNIGTAQNPVFGNSVDYNRDGDLYRTYYDWNKDGLLDFFDVIDYWRDASYAYYQNVGPKSNPQYMPDNANGPKFKNGLPYRMIDLNNDGEPEVFDFNAHYSTLAPVAVIQDTIVKKDGISITVLESANRSGSATTIAGNMMAKPLPVPPIITSYPGRQVSTHYL